MKRLTLETFVAGSQDAELGQYRVLQALKEYQDEFAHSRLYPSLAELLEVSTSLDSVLQSKGDMENHLPQRIKEIDLDEQKLVYEPVVPPDVHTQRATDLIQWALPLIRKAIEEGLNIYNFVESHLAIAEVGIMPMYREEGYWFMPDSRAGQVHLFRYQISLFTSASERFRTLKTRLLDSIEFVFVRRPPEAIKRDLISRYHDLPNPATYICETDIDFPYGETMLPVAKRKFIRELCA